jgi:hypothetical protein
MLVIEDLIKQPLMVGVERLHKLVLRRAGELWFLIENHSLSL